VTRRAVLGGVLIVITACSSPSPLPTDAATGLPILSELPAFDGSRGATAWQEANEAPDGFGPATTEHLDLASIVGAFGGLARGQDIEFEMGFLGPPSADAATLLVHATRPDEAIAGDEIIVELGRNDRGWFMELTRYRTHCRRGLDAEGQSCI
jgi:hypothetical protein